MLNKKKFKDYSDEDLGEILKFYQDLMSYLEKNNNTVPYARPIDRDGVERYDKADGNGFYRIAYNDFIYYGGWCVIKRGEYMNIPGYSDYVVPTKEIKKYLKFMNQILKEIKHRNQNLEKKANKGIKR